MRSMTLLTILIATPAFATSPPVDNKFAAYGGPNYSIDTELRGVVVSVQGSNLFIQVDPNYQNLLLEGNRRYPAPGEDGYDDYVANFPDAFRNNFQPMIKLETYGVGGRLSSDNTGAPPLVHFPDGTSRPIQLWDHVVVNGLYVIDYAHSMYSSLCTSTFSYMRGLYKACYPHAEIHPYDYDTIAWAAPATPGGVAIESHTVAAPVYTQYYSLTYGWNKLWGVAGNLVDDSAIVDAAADFLLQPPPLPTNGCSGGCQLMVIPDPSGSYGSGTYSTHINPDNTVSVHMTAHGTDVTNPSVEHVTFYLLWYGCDVLTCTCVNNNCPSNRPSCSTTNVCCARTCTGKPCGADDGCGSACGCPYGQACSAGVCVPTNTCPIGQSQCDCLGGCATTTACNACNGICPIGQSYCPCTDGCTTAAACRRCNLN